MTAIDDAYSDIIKRVDNSTVTVARIARRAETFREAAFELLTEPTDAGNVRLLKTTRDMSAEVIDGLNKTKASLPEKATEMNKLSDTLSTAFSACKPSIEAAAKTTDQAELTKIGERLRTECSTVLQAAIEQAAKATGEIGQQVSAAVPVGPRLSRSSGVAAVIVGVRRRMPWDYARMSTGVI